MNNNPTNNTHNLRFSNIDLDNNSNFKNFMLLTGVFSFLLSGLFFLINRLTILFLFLFSLTTIFTLKRLDTKASSFRAESKCRRF